MTIVSSVTRAPAPLVWTTGRGVYCWVEHGLGFLLSTNTGRWVPLVDVELCGGRTLTTNERLSLVMTYGRPTP